MLIQSADIERDIAALDAEEAKLLLTREQVAENLQRGQALLGHTERRLVEVRAERRALRRQIQRQEAALKEAAGKSD